MLKRFFILFYFAVFLVLCVSSQVTLSEDQEKQSLTKSQSLQNPLNLTMENLGEYLEYLRLKSIESKAERKKLRNQLESVQQELTTASALLTDSINSGEILKKELNSANIIIKNSQNSITLLNQELRKLKQNDLIENILIGLGSGAAGAALDRFVFPH